MITDTISRPSKNKNKLSHQATQISPLSEQCLTSLGRFTFLTVDQCELTVSSNSTARIRRELKALSDLGLVGVLRQQRLAGRKFVYFLTKKGAHVLSHRQRKPIESFRFKTERSVSFSTDYEHRILTIRAHIELTKALGQTTICFNSDEGFSDLSLRIHTWHTYFHKQGANRNAKTSKQPLRTESRIDLPDGKTLIPDVNFVLADSTNNRACFLAVLEITRGRDVSRIIRQVQNHIEVMKLGTLPDHYGIPAHYPVLFLCEEASFVSKIQTRFRTLPNAKAFDRSFLFASFSRFLEHPLTCWATACCPERFINFITGR